MLSASARRDTAKLNTGTSNSGTSNAGTLGLGTLCLGVIFVAACSSTGRRLPSIIRVQEGDGIAAKPVGVIAFVSERAGQPEVFAVSGGDSPRAILNEPIAGFVAPVGPNGEVLVVTSTGDDADAMEQLHIVRGGALTALTPPTRFVRNPSWMPNGSHVVIESNFEGFRNLFVVALDGSDPEQLTQCKHGCFEPSVSPDGAWVAYASPDTGDGEIHLIEVATKQTRRLTWSKGTDKRPTWSPDGQRIAFITNRHGAPAAFVMLRDGSSPRALRRFDEPDLLAERDLTWSPDGRLVAWVAQRKGTSRVRVVRVANGELVGSSEDKHIDRRPCFSPDGAHIAFSSEREGNTDVYTMRTDGSVVRRITHSDAADWLPRWTKTLAAKTFE